MGIKREGDVFLLTADTMGYVVSLADGRVFNRHWGGRIDRFGDLPTVAERQRHRHRPPRQAEAMYREYPAFYGEFYNECAFKAAYPDGTGSTELLVADSRIVAGDGCETLEIELREKYHPLTVTLHYRVWDDTPLIDRWAVFRNGDDRELPLERFASAAWQLPEHVAAGRLTHLYGHWGKEAMVERQPIAPGKFVMESRTGLSGPFAAPFFAVDGGGADEESGEVFFGALAWSGNWKLAVDRDSYGHTAVLGGLNEFDNALILRPGETFATPVFTGGWTAHGWGGMSRALHRHQLRHVLPPAVAAKPMPFLFNSWGSLGIDVNEERILAAARGAQRIGAELFVIDDGWQHALGDWRPDPVKFPGGLRPVIEAVRGFGMDFGLWVEIESFELASDLYKRHPEWAMHYPGREPFRKYRADVDRTSVMLNLAREDVAEYLHASLRKLIGETGLAYLKLDMNCFVSSPGWGDAPPEQRGRLWIDYVRNLWGIFERLTSEFPGLLLENCAAGGGRADWAMPRWFGRVNRSDNQDALDMLTLHEGFTQMNHPRFAGGACHISDSMVHINERRTPLQFQAYCGMLGSLACGKDLARCDAAELDAIRAYGDLYKRLRHVTHFGDFHRLTSPYTHPYAIYAYVSADRREAVVFILGASQRFADRQPPARIPGLLPDAVYSVTMHGGPDGAEMPSAISGRGAAVLGLPFQLLGDYDSRILHLRAVEA